MDDEDCSKSLPRTLLSIARRLSYKFTRAVLHCSLTPEHVDSDAMVEESTGENDVLTTSLLQSVSGGKASSMEVVSSFTTSDIYSTHSTAPGQGRALRVMGAGSG